MTLRSTGLGVAALTRGEFHAFGEDISDKKMRA
jgi:hypothetical protein